MAHRQKNPTLELMHGGFCLFSFFFIFLIFFSDDHDPRKLLDIDVAFHYSILPLSNDYLYDSSAHSSRANARFSRLVKLTICRNLSVQSDDIIVPLAPPNLGLGGISSEKLLWPSLV